MSEETPGAGEAGLRVGDCVRKTKGFRFPGEVRCVFTTTAGKTLCVVEAGHDDFAGMVHIYNPEQLETVSRAPEPKPAAQCGDERIRFADHAAMMSSKSTIITRLTDELAKVKSALQKLWDREDYNCDLRLNQPPYCGSCPLCMAREALAASQAKEVGRG